MATGPSNARAPVRSSRAVSASSPRPGRTPLARLVDVRPGETAAALWAFASFFLLLAGYYVLRSLREEMGIRGGVENLPWNFTATLAAMLVAVPVYSRLVARVPRARAVPLVYRFFLVTLLAFWALLRLEAAPAAVARALFVWVSVYGLFVVSVFWSLAADLFTTDQAKRLFGFVAAGGSAGAIAGPAGVDLLVGLLGVPDLVLVAALLLEGATQSMGRIVGWWRRTGACARAAEGGGPPAGEPGGPLGGSAWSGVALVFGDRYLVAIAAQMLLFTLGSTLLYFQVAHLLAASGLDSASRTRLFARVDLAVNVAALLTGALATGRLVARLGLGAALAVVPALSAAGFALVASWPSFWVLAAFQALRRAASYAVERPAREVLFTVVTREERYKSKAFVDTVVYRAGDAGSAWIARGLAAAGVGVAGSLLVAAPIGLVGVGLAVWLAREERAREGRLLAEPPGADRSLTGGAAGDRR
jgi:AAA family ATP:ADP antiporter